MVLIVIVRDGIVMIHLMIVLLFTTTPSPTVREVGEHSSRHPQRRQGGVQGLRQIVRHACAQEHLQRQ